MAEEITVADQGAVAGGDGVVVASEIVSESNNSVRSRDLTTDTVKSKTSGNGPSIEAPERSLLCVMFTPYTWFNTKRLNPRVENLIYWRDPKKSAPVFVGVLVLLLALTYISLISVVAYLSLLVLTVTIAFRIYKNILQAIQKTGDSHPFRAYLELDVSIPQQKAQELSSVAVAHVNAAVVELRRLFLVEDLVDSIKFGVLLWVMTYVGSWFNGMTLIIMVWLTLFTLPKVYEANQSQIDANVELVRIKIAELATKVKAAVPIGKSKVEKEE